MSEIALEKLESRSLDAAAMQQISVAAVRARREAIVELMREAMQEGVDYGLIPGCTKPTLFQPGSQKLLNLFQLDPEFEQMPDSKLEETFILHSYKCTLFHAPSGLRIASGVGSCNSREEKYGMRNANRKCPKCAKETIISGKKEYGGGWLCFKKKGGCGAKFLEDDPVIVGQPAGKTPNENIWEQENTIRKMAQKRALIAATLNATGASDIFTQDVEDMAEFQQETPPEAGSHREAHEHATNFCRECTQLGIPSDCFAVLLKGHIYLRDSKHAAVEPHERHCPACKGKVPESASATEPHGFSEFLETMRRAKLAIGNEAYYKILHANKYAHANEVKEELSRSAIRREMLLAYNVTKQSEFPEEKRQATNSRPSPHRRHRERPTPENYQPATSEPGPVPPIGGLAPTSEFLETMQAWRLNLGDTAYFTVLGSNGFEKPEQILTEDDQSKMLQAMILAAGDREQAGRPVFGKKPPIQYPD